MEGKLYLICGDDDYLVDTAAREDQSARAGADREFGVEIVDGQRDTADEITEAVNACMESVQTLAFGATKVTWFRDVTFLTGGGRSAGTIAAKEAVQKLTTWLGGLLSGQTLTTTTKVLRNSTFFKTCQQQGEIQDFGSGTRLGSLRNWPENVWISCSSKQAHRRRERARRFKRVGHDTRLL